MTKEIPLSKGYLALVDDEDYERIVALGPWHARVGHRTVYAGHTIMLPERKTFALLMHRAILNLDPDDPRDVDHDDHNGLNNQKLNLCALSRAENLKNMQVRRDSTSGILGVTWVTAKGMWQANIRSNGKSKYLGDYATVEEAAGARAAAALKYGHKR